MSEKLENRIKEGNLTWASYLAPLAQQGSPAHHRRRPPGASRPGVWPTRAHGRSATPPARLPAYPASATPRCFFSVPPRSPGLTPSLPNSSPSSAPSPSRARAQPQPRHRNAAATVSPSTPRCACELRLDPLFLSTEPRGPGRAATPPPSPFPSPATEDRRGRFAASDASPRPPSCSSTSL